MSNQRPPKSLLTFYRSGPMPCPYLPGRTERQLFTELSGPDATNAFNILSKGGFRRSHHIAYRPACDACEACIPVRVVASAFRYSRAWRRVIRTNRDLVATEIGLAVSEEQYRLFRSYMTNRHGEGDMARMTIADYTAMVVDSPVDTSLVEFRVPDGRLVAACLMDRLADGLSAVYSFFDPDEARRSLGSYMVLWLIERARQTRLDYVYLGYWIADSRKMDYKARFRPIEAFHRGAWRQINPETSASSAG